MEKHAVKKRWNPGSRSWSWYLVKVREKIRERGVVYTVQRCVHYAWQRLTRTAPILDSVLIEVTTYCNMKCAGCLRTLQVLEGKWENQHMTVQDFRRIVEALPPTGDIVTQGVGEPTLHPDLPELIRIAHRAHKFNRITLTTNAMARDVDYYSQLFAAGLTTLFISVDSLDPVLANRLRAGTSVDKLKERIRILASRFPRKVGIMTVVGRENIESIPELLAELNKLGKLDVAMHPYDNLGAPSGCLSMEERASFKQRIPVIAASFPNLRVFANNFIPSSRVCLGPWQAPAITVDGYLTPCCRIMDKNIFNFGNVIANPFPEVWHARETEQWRQRFLQKSPPICAGCPWYIMR